MAGGSGGHNGGRYMVDALRRHARLHRPEYLVSGLLLAIKQLECMRYDSAKCLPSPRFNERGSRLLEKRAEHHVYRETSPSNNTHVQSWIAREANVDVLMRYLTGPNLLPRAYASAVAEVNPLTWSLALEWALSNKA
jgi:hypothetical protein